MERAGDQRAVGGTRQTAARTPPGWLWSTWSAHVVWDACVCSFPWASEAGHASACWRDRLMVHHRELPNPQRLEAWNGRNDRGEAAQPPLRGFPLQAQEGKGGARILTQTTRRPKLGRRVCYAAAAGPAVGSRGSAKRIVVPRPAALSASILPPCARTRLRAMASPNPLPVESAVL
jgi:hypothetical protein